MKNGFLYPTSNLLVGLLKSINLVEYAKDLSALIYRRCKRRELVDEEIIAAKNIGIDIFQVLKWLLLIIFLLRPVESLVATFIVCYLILSNLFTYFYYHVWKSAFQQRTDLHSQRRRFISFLLSIFFFVVSYTYIYQYPLAQHIAWPDDTIDVVNALYLSVSNAFTLIYGDFKPLTQTARLVFISELINTFFFFTIIVVNSIPSISNRDK